MNEVSVNRPPRVLDFTRSLDGARASSDLAWPCHAFRVSVPIRTKPRLNIFEETVLRLLNNARVNALELQEFSGFDSHLVTLVYNRLLDLNLINEHDELTDEGKKYLKVEENREHKSEIRYVVRELVSGSLLPVLLDSELRYEELRAWDRVSATIQKRNGQVIPLRLVSNTQADPSPTPTTDDVWLAYRHHEELSRQFSALRKVTARPPRLLGALMISVDPLPEYVFLRCRVVIPAVEDDYRIGDPFGFGYSDVLFRAFEALRATGTHENIFIQKLRDESLTVKNYAPKANSKFKAEEDTVLRELGAAITGYREIFENLRAAETDLSISISQPKNRDEEAQFGYYAMKTASTLTEAIETTLACIISLFTVPTCEALMSSPDQSQLDNAELLERLAIRLGFRTKRIGLLLEVPPGRIRSMREDNQIDLQALLAVSLLGAEENPDHPMRRLARSFPDWLAFLNDLKRMRDAGLHGQTRNSSISRLQELRKGTYRSIQSLLPALDKRILVRQPVEIRSEIEVNHDERRRAISKLESIFGVKLIVQISRDTKELLIQIERSIESFGPGLDQQNVRHPIVNLASVVQTIIHARHNVYGSDGSALPSVNAASERAITAGLLRKDEVLPASLSRVKPRRFHEALQGQNPTLGANVLALLMLSPLERLQRLSLTAPKFLDLAARLITLRGHGNKPVWMSVDEFLKFKSEIYLTCIAFMESFDERG